MGNKEDSSEHGQKELLGRYIHSEALAETPQMEARSQEGSVAGYRDNVWWKESFFGK